MARRRMTLRRLSSGRGQHLQELRVGAECHLRRAVPPLDHVLIVEVHHHLRQRAPEDAPRHVLHKGHQLVPVEHPARHLRGLSGLGPRHMKGDGGGDVEARVPGQQDAQAEIDVLAVHEVVLVETASRLDRRSAVYGSGARPRYRRQAGVVLPLVGLMDTACRAPSVRVVLVTRLVDQGAVVVEHHLAGHEAKTRIAVQLVGESLDPLGFAAPCRH